jgi:hypothetical protein
VVVTHALGVFLNLRAGRLRQPATTGLARPWPPAPSRSTFGAETHTQHTNTAWPNPGMQRTRYARR